LQGADGSQHIVAFRTDADAKKVACGGVETTGRVFAQHKDKQGRTLRQFTTPR
jgi:hypothetical protein